MIVLSLLASNRFAVRRLGRAGESVIDISTLLHNLAVAGAIERGARLAGGFTVGRHAWMPGCGMEAP